MGSNSLSKAWNYHHLCSENAAPPSQCHCPFPLGPSLWAWRVRLQNWNFPGRCTLHGADVHDEFHQPWHRKNEKIDKDCRLSWPFNKKMSTRVRSTTIWEPRGKFGWLLRADDWFRLQRFNSRHVSGPHPLTYCMSEAQPYWGYSKTKPNLSSVSPRSMLSKFKVMKT